MDVDVEFYRENVVYRSWADHNLSFAVEDPINGLAGFRKPQRAAAFAIFSHLDADPETPAIVVMPTGTGKTDTIFAVIIAARFCGACERSVYLCQTDEDLAKHSALGRCVALEILDIGVAHVGESLPISGKYESGQDAP